MIVVAAANAAEVKMELWRSFISVLRSYAALANTDEGGGAVNIDDSPFSIVWSRLSANGLCRCSLSVCYDAPKDKGMWRASRDEEPFRLTKVSHVGLGESMRPFALNLDGTVSLDGGTLDMDHAAMEMLGFLAAAVKSGDVEVPA